MGPIARILPIPLNLKAGMEKDRQMSKELV